MGGVVPGGETPLDAAHEPATTTPVSALDLSSVEADDEEAERPAESLERRQADLELRNDLALAGFDGPEWRRFAEELARYGRAVMKAWCYSGEIFNQCRKKNCYPGPSPEHWTDDDRDGLADDVVTAAIIAFRDRALIGRGWDWRAGASLKTYFIGACVYQFPNAFRRWRTEDQTWNQLRRLDPSADELLHQRHRDDTEDLALIHLESSTAFDAIPDDRTKIAMLLHSQGYTYPEIADLLDTSVKAVDGLLIRHRKRAASTSWRTS
ncbi:RNA polymerase sigma factor [Pseudonocardia sichuanensis]